MLQIKLGILFLSTIFMFYILIMAPLIYDKIHMTLIKYRMMSNPVRLRLSEQCLMVLRECNLLRRRRRGCRGGRNGRSRTHHESSNNDVELGVRITNRFPRVKNRNVDFDNLINIPLYNLSTPLVFGCINLQSLCNKSALFSHTIEEEQIDVCALTETWLKRDDKVIRNCATPVGYTLLDTPRNNRRGGGVGVLCKDSLKPKVFSKPELQSCEVTEYILNLNSKSFLISVLYRPPSNGNLNFSVTDFLNEFELYLESLILKNLPIIITGDFNIHFDMPDNHSTVRFIEILNHFGLTNHVNFPTHTSGHILDIFITRDSDRINIPFMERRSFISDHCLIRCMLDLPKPSFEKRSISFRKLKTINSDELSADIR